MRSRRHPTGVAARSGRITRAADFQAPATAAAWRDRVAHVRDQMLVTLGLWPMFPKTPMNPRIYGKLSRDGYTIEKVVLETFPGFTLSGNLYRPIGATGKMPGILCPHGHWDDGRVNPEVQQRCIRWAKLGCVVFLYDMVGYNDSKPFPHEFLDDRLRQLGPEPDDAPDLEQHPGARLADLAARRRRRRGSAAPGNRAAAPRPSC